MSGFLRATSFLTRIPVKEHAHDPRDLARSVVWFPIVGGALGIGLAAIYAGGRELWPSAIAAVVAIGAGVLATGGFHEDGLADTADALGGAYSKDEALRIFKDPTHGTYGVIAIVLSLLVRILAVATLDGTAAVAVLPAAHALSRSAAIALLAFFPAAGEGLGASYGAHVTTRHVRATAIVGIAVGCVSMGGWGLVGAAATVPGAILVGRLAVRRVGGLTGDVLGAVQQVAEVAVFLVAAALVANGWGEPAWWR